MKSRIRIIFNVVLALAGITLLPLSAACMGNIGEITNEGLSLLFFGLLCMGLSYLGTVWCSQGYLTTPTYLDQKIIYSVEGQIKTSDRKNTVVVRNATDKGGAYWVENPEPLDSNVRLVKVVQEKGKYKLVPLKEEVTETVADK